MSETAIPRGLSPLQNPIERVLWHEIGKTLSKHYGEDVEIRQALTKLTRSSFGEQTIVLEGDANAAIAS